MKLQDMDNVLAFIGVVMGGFAALKFMLPYLVKNMTKASADLEKRLDKVELKIDDLAGDNDNRNNAIIAKLDGILEVLNDSKVKQAILETDIENIKQQIKEIKKELARK